MQNVSRKRLPRDAVWRGGFGAVFQRHVEMVLKVLADARQVLHNVIPCLASSRALPMPESISRCGDTNEPGRKDHFLAAIVPVSPPRLKATPVAVVPSNTIFVTCVLANDGEVWAAAHRVQIGAFRSHAQPVLLREIVKPDAVLPRAIEVGIELVAGKLRGLQIGVSPSG